MKELTELIIRPNTASYQASRVGEVISTNTQGGAPRQRTDILGSWRPVTVQWTVTNKGFEYLTAFYVGVTKNGALPFNIQLLIDSPEITMHQAVFTPDSFGHTLEGGVFTVSAQLLVKPAKPSGLEVDLVWLVNTYGWNWDKVFDQLDPIVNKRIPSIWNKP